MGYFANRTISYDNIHTYEEMEAMAVSKRNLKPIVTTRKAFIQCNSLHEADYILLLTDPFTPNTEVVDCFKIIHILYQSIFRKKLLEKTSKLFKA